MRKPTAAAALAAAAGVAATVTTPVGAVAMYLRQTPVAPAGTAAPAPVGAPAAAVGARVTALACLARRDKKTLPHPSWALKNEIPKPQWR